MQVLAIIDVQPTFSAANPTIVKNVLAEIEKSKKLGQHIIVIEYEDECYKIEPTFSEVLKAVKGYKKVHRKKKYDLDGSRQIANSCKKWGIAPTTIKVCGVNTDACVCETVWGLQEKGFHVSIIEHACNSEYEHQKMIDSWKTDNTIKVI